MRRRSLFPLVLLVSLVVAPPGDSLEGILPPFYSAKEIQATVVDAETVQPIDGAVVVAVWQLDAISGQGPRLQVSEAVSDTEGKFSIPGWGPKPRPPMTHFTSKSPYLVVFKGAYVPVILYNPPKAHFARLRALPNLTAEEISYRTPIEGNPYDAVQESFWSGMTIRIVPFRGTPEEWFRHLDMIKNAVVREDSRKARSFYEALAAQREYFRVHPVDPRKVTNAVFDSVFADIERRSNGARERR